ncbi:MAG: aryl-sulfate sulfotransferase, partial [Acidimicrobiales bacterium]
SLTVTGRGQITFPVSLVESQAVVIRPSSVDQTPYWIRCLPHDFPEMQFDRPGSPSPGWYLTGNFGLAKDGSSSTYAIILDNQGTPVWYQKAPGGAIDTRLLPGGTPETPKIAWAPNLGPTVGADQNGGYNVYDLATRTSEVVTTTTGPTDQHELLTLPNGNRMMIASPLRSGFDLSGFPAMAEANNTIVDCVIEEIHPSGQAVWVWRASDHISPAENTHPVILTVNGQSAADIYHCNSVDVEPPDAAIVSPSADDVLISLRHTDSLYLIDRGTGGISWKLGGNSQPGFSTRPRFAVQGGLSGQHDGRFQPPVSGKKRISLYDNGTFSDVAARALELTIDEAAGTATTALERRAPDGKRALATGSFRRYEASDLIGWGLKTADPAPRVDGFTELDKQGTPLFSMFYPKGDAGYRVVKEPLGALDADLLRETAGLVSVAPPVPFVSLSPQRVWDSRVGLGPIGQIGPSETRDITVTGVVGIPTTGVDAVVLNVTAVEPTAGTFITAWPTGQVRPEASNLNVPPGDTRANLVVVKVGPSGKISFFNAAGKTHLLADVAGYYSRGGGERYSAVSPSRIWDSRSGPGPTGQVGPGETKHITVTGMGDVPATGVSAIVLNVTAVSPTARTFITAWPAGVRQPHVSNLNVPAGDTRPNLVVVKVGAGGQVSFFNDAGRTHLLADVAGYYSSTGAGFNSLTPRRLLDSRIGRNPLGSKETRSLKVTGAGGVPGTGVTAVVLNVTAVAPTASTFITAWPSGEGIPYASNLNVPAGDIRPNLVFVKVGAGGQVDLFNQAGSTHFLVDVAGWY